MQGSGFGKFVIGGPIALLPAMVTMAAFENLITKDILMFKTPCPVCIETRAAATAMLGGVVFPTLAAMGGNYIFFTIWGRRMPAAFSKESLPFLKRLFRRITPTLTFFSVLQVAASGFIAYRMHEEWIDINEKLLQRQARK